jgi:uncharacterized protein (TIGR02996 family)
MAVVQMLLSSSGILTDNDALLLALLDRPHDVETRLVCADWLEDTGDLDLAQWLRLDTSLSRLAPGARPRPQVDRLLDLQATHRDDWLFLAGIMLPWDRVLSLLVRRLAETMAWCNKPEAPELRTPEFLPQVGGAGRAIEPLWRCPAAEARTTLVHHLAGRRARKLAQLGLEPPRSTLDLGSGRLLLFEPERAFGDPSVSMDGFLDRYQVPAWDTWLFYLDEGPGGRRRIHAHWEAEWILGRKLEPAVFASYLVAWVPGPLTAGVDWSLSVQAESPVAWAEDVDCVLTARLRDLGLLRKPQPKAAAPITRRERRVEPRVAFLR